MDSPSPFSLYLGTNYAATTEEILVLTNFLSEPISKLVRLKEELDGIQAHYHSVLQQYDALSKSIDNHRSLMAPIRRIPMDVFQEIFIHCLPHEHNAIMSKHKCPLLLTQICSGWRRIALNTPVLWKSIHIPMPNYDSSHHYNEAKRVLAVARESRRVELIKHWLSRSGSTTLNISLYHGLNIPLMDIYDIILDALIPLSPRWGTLQCPSSFFSLERIANIDVNQLPRLHTISLHDPAVNHHLLAMPGRPPSQLIKWKNSTLIRAPSLRSVSYKQEGVDSTIYDLPLQWGRLTKIEFTVASSFVISFARLATLLVGCHQLESLRIDLTYPHPLGPVLTDYQMPSTVFLPSLTSLFVTERQSRDLGGFLDALDTPMLKDFEGFCSKETRPSLLAFLTRAAQALRHLGIDPLLFTDREAFFTFLSAFNNVVTLHLRPIIIKRADDPPNALMDLDDVFLHELLTNSKTQTNTSGSKNVLLPQLARFTCAWGTIFTDVCALEAIRTRNDIASSALAGTHSKLRAVELHFGYAQQRPLLAELEHLAGGDGVRCTFKFCPPLPASLFSPVFGTPGYKWNDEPPRQYGYIPVAF